MEFATLLATIEPPNNPLFVEYYDCDMNGHSEYDNIKLEPISKEKYIVRYIWNMTDLRDNRE